jgi:hypothetical protein
LLEFILHAFKVVLIALTHVTIQIAAPSNQC